MQDKPSDRDLLNAVAQFLQEEIEPHFSDNPRLRFRVLIAINVLSIINRELGADNSMAQAEWERLNQLTGQAPQEMPAELRPAIEQLNSELSQRLRQGSAGDEAWRDKLFAHLQATVIEKLQIANPRFLERAQSA